MSIVQTNHEQKTSPQISITKDLHSYSNPQHVIVKHLHLDLEVDFQQQVLSGQATLDLDRITPNEPLVLDAMDLNIARVDITDGDSDYVETTFSLGATDPILGSPLIINLNERANRVRIAYSTLPGAKGLQWLLPEQAEFATYLRKELLDTNQERAKLIPLDEWLYQPGLPASTPRPSCDAFYRIEQQADRWLGGELDAEELSQKHWNTHEWLHFLKYLPKTLERARMEELDAAFHLTNVENSEIAHVWLLLAS